MGMISLLLLSHPNNLKSIEARQRLRRGIKVVSFTYPGKGTVEFSRLSVPKHWQVILYLLDR